MSSHQHWGVKSMAAHKDRTKKEMYELFDELEENDDFYSENEIGSLLEDDEISDEEEAFMMGYMDLDEAR